MKELKGKVAVITGSASGMGRGVAERCAQEGMKVVLADIEQKALDKAEKELKAAGATVLAVRTDVSKVEDLQALAKKTLDTFGVVHLLHNNAGIGTGHAFLETSLGDWKWIMGVNLWGPIYGIWTFLPIMLKQDIECHIVTTISMGGLISTPWVSGYNVTKFGVMGICETLDYELRLMGAKIGVSVLCPGYVNTNIPDSERNRPPEFRNDPAWDEKLREIEHYRKLDEMQRQGCKGGMDPKDVAEIVINGVRENKFYLYTHPEWMMAAQIRTEEILQQRDPTSMIVDVLLYGESSSPV